MFAARSVLAALLVAVVVTTALAPVGDASAGRVALRGARNRPAGDRPRHRACDRGPLADAPPRIFDPPDPPNRTARQFDGPR